MNGNQQPERSIFQPRTNLNKREWHPEKLDVDCFYFVMVVLYWNYIRSLIILATWTFCQRWSRLCAFTDLCSVLFMFDVFLIVTEDMADKRLEFRRGGCSFAGERGTCMAATMYLLIQWNLKGRISCNLSPIVIIRWLYKPGHTHPITTLIWPIATH